MDLSIQMKVIHNLKHCYAICLKFLHNFSNQISAESKSQYLLYNQRKFTLMLS